jgi:hypothetical protein
MCIYVDLHEVSGEVGVEKISTYSSWRYPFQTSALTEDGSCTFLWNFDNYLKPHTASQPRTQPPSLPPRKSRITEAVQFPGRKMKRPITGEISGSHGSEYGYHYLLEYRAVMMGA